MKIRTNLFLATLTAAAFASSANADLIKIDFGKAKGEAAGNYNNINDSSSSNSNFNGVAISLDDFNTGLDTGIDLTVSGPTNSFWGDSGSGANYNGPYPAAVASEPATATGDGLFSFGETVTLTFSALTVGQAYEFLIYSARGNNGPDATFTPTVFGTSGGADSISIVKNNDDETATLTGTSDVNGVFAFTWTNAGATGNASALNFIQVSEVPEPGSLALMGLGTLCVLKRRRRSA
jgi:hypothetical protein